MTAKDKNKVKLKKGEICSHCGVYFERPNGHRVVCKSCSRTSWYKRLKKKIPISRVPEIDGKEVIRKRREMKWKKEVL